MSSEAKIVPAEFALEPSIEPDPKAPLAVVQPTPMTLIDRAVSGGASIETLEKLFSLQLRWEANEAKKAFMAAMNAFKADPPEILKNHKVAYGTTAYDHATLDHVCEAITGALSKHDISHRWRVEQSEGLLRVTCILTHKGGHSEETTLCGGPDTSGSKNAIQAIGSTVTYLERYTLLAATGLAAKNGDNDGQGAPAMETLQLHLDRMMAAENLTVLDKAFRDAFKEATTLKNTQAMLALITAKDNKKKELTKDESA